MSDTEKESRGTVQPGWEPGSALSYPRDGWAVPRILWIKAALPTGVRVHIDIRVTSGKARARRVEITSESGYGVGWKALSSVPTRDLVAKAVLFFLYRTGPVDEDGTQKLLSPGPPGWGNGGPDLDEALEVMRQVVGYRPNPDGFTVGEVG